MIGAAIRRALARNLCVFDEEAPPGCVTAKLLSLMEGFFTNPESPFRDEPAELLFEDGAWFSWPPGLAVRGLPPAARDFAYSAGFSPPAGKGKMILLVGKGGMGLLGAV